MDKVVEELLVRWIETSNPVVFPEKLNSGTDDFRYEILAVLIADKFHNIKQAPPR
jgi:hypothetical protein